MFRISAIQDKNEQKSSLEACGGKFNPDYFAYSMRENESGELMGVSQFEITSKEGYISDLCSAPKLDDFEAMFILGRATMNFIDMCGAHTCYISKYAADERLIKALGFKLDSYGKYFVDMTDMFSGHCGDHK